MPVNTKSPGKLNCSTINTPKRSIPTSKYYILSLVKKKKKKSVKSGQKILVMTISQWKKVYQDTFKEHMKITNMVYVTVISYFTIQLWQKLLSGKKLKNIL